VSDGIQGLHQLAISDRNNYNANGERLMLQTEESSKGQGFWQDQQMNNNGRIFAIPAFLIDLSR